MKRGSTKTLMPVFDLSVLQYRCSPGDLVASISALRLMVF
jgi:hypothetical protein